MKHGRYLHPMYKLWDNVHQRCNNPNSRSYGNYGGRGISVCREWGDIEVFFSWCSENGWRKELQIDRIDNDGNYEPGNCRFVSNFENNLNTQLLKVTNTTGYRGVSPHGDKYVAGVKVHYKRKHLGLFDTPVEAARVRDNYVIKNNLGLPLNFGISA